MSLIEYAKALTVLDKALEEPISAQSPGTFEKTRHTMKYGLTENEIIWLYDKLVTPLKNQGASVYIFGSRARGTHQQFSDIDILVVSTKNLTALISAKNILSVQVGCTC